MLPVVGLPSGIGFHRGIFYDKHDSTKINLSFDFKVACQTLELSVKKENFEVWSG